MQALDSNATDLVIRPILDMRSRSKVAHWQREWHVAVGDVKLHLHPKPESHLSSLSSEEYSNMAAIEAPKVTRTKCNKHTQAKLWIVAFLSDYARRHPARARDHGDERQEPRTTEGFLRHTHSTQWNFWLPVKMQLPLFL